MKIPSKQHLLTEQMGHAERVRRVALLGRDAAGTVELNKVKGNHKGLPLT